MTGKQDICVRLPSNKICANGKAGMAMYVIVPNCEKNVSRWRSTLFAPVVKPRCCKIIPCSSKQLGDKLGFPATSESVFGWELCRQSISSNSTSPLEKKAFERISSSVDHDG